MGTTVSAWCCGRPVEVAVKPGPVDHRRVGCRTCGAQRGRECTDLQTKGPLYTGHASRRAEAVRLYGGAQ